MTGGPERTEDAGSEGSARSLWRRWLDGEGVTAEEVLRVSSRLRPEQLVDAVLADQRRRWEEDDRVPAEEYFERHPSLSEKPECAVDVIYHEFLLREERGERPRQEEYLNRFPTFGEVLARQFALRSIVDSDDDTPVPGIGPFEIVEPIGMGSRGYVFRALDRKTRLEVALKVLHDHPISEDERAGFIRVAKAASELEHPGIARPLDFAVGSDGCYIAYPFIAGPTLAGVLDEGPLPPGEAAEIARKISGAVCHAQERGVVHHDLTAGNILLAPEGEPLITDYGIPSAAGAGGSGGVRGSPVHRLGRILYEALTGDRPPPEGPTWSTFRTWGKVLPRPRRLNPAVPPELETICLKALSAAPSFGYPTVGALEKDLGSYLEASPLQARPGSGWRRWWGSKRRRSRDDAGRS